MVDTDLDLGEDLFPQMLRLRSSPSTLFGWQPLKKASKGPKVQPGGIFSAHSDCMSLGSKASTLIEWPRQLSRQDNLNFYYECFSRISKFYSPVEFFPQNGKDEGTAWKKPFFTACTLFFRAKFIYIYWASYALLILFFDKIIFIYSCFMIIENHSFYSITLHREWKAVYPLT